MKHIFVGKSCLIPSAAHAHVGRANDRQCGESPLPERREADTGPTENNARIRNNVQTLQLMIVLWTKTVSLDAVNTSGKMARNSEPSCEGRCPENEHHLARGGGRGVGGVLARKDVAQRRTGKFACFQVQSCFALVN